VLYTVSVPWYRTPGETVSSVGGLPEWVAVALACYAAAAVLNALAWLVTDVPDAVDAPGESPDPAVRRLDPLTADDQAASREPTG
jgi:hypothetical protein